MLCCKLAPFLGRERAAVDFDVAVRSVARDDEGKEVGERRLMMMWVMRRSG